MSETSAFDSNGVAERQSPRTTTVGHQGREMRRMCVRATLMIVAMALPGMAPGCGYLGGSLSETRRLTADLSAVVVPSGRTKNVSCTFEIRNETERVVGLVPRVVPCYGRQVRLDRSILRPGEVAKVTITRRVGSLVRRDTLFLKAFVERSDGVRYECTAGFLAVPRIEVTGVIGLGTVAPGVEKSFEAKVLLNVDPGEEDAWTLRVARLPTRPYTTRVQLSRLRKRELYPGIVSFEYVLRGQLHDISLLRPLPLPYDTYVLEAVRQEYVDRRSIQVVWQAREVFMVQPESVTLDAGAQQFTVHVRAADGERFRITGWYVRGVRGQRVVRERSPLQEVRWRPAEAPNTVYEVMAAVSRNHHMPWFELVLTTDREDQPIVPVAVLCPSAGP